MEFVTGSFLRIMNDAMIDYWKEQLADAPEALDFLLRNEGSFSDALFEQLLLEVDDSPFPLIQWFGSLCVLERWLLARGKNAAFGDQIGYISCAASTVTSSLSETFLPEVVEQMLQDYGFERAY